MRGGVDTIGEPAHDLYSGAGEASSRLERQLLSDSGCLPRADKRGPWPGFQLSADKYCQRRSRNPAQRPGEALLEQRDSSHPRAFRENDLPLRGLPLFRLESRSECEQRFRESRVEQSLADLLSKALLQGEKQRAEGSKMLPVLLR